MGGARASSASSSQKIDALRDNPKLRLFVLSNVRLTSTRSRIGAGTYGSVEEVAIPGPSAAAQLIRYTTSFNCKIL